MADAAITAWDAKFSYDFWRPVTAIQQAGNDGSGFDDGNPNTVGDINWRPMGAPGIDPNSTLDDFTPPFPSWTSGHATMGSAMYEALAKFFNTNSFSVAAANNGVNPGTGEYLLNSAEFAPNGTPGMQRSFDNFIQSGDPATFNLGQESSPEGEIAASRIYLGIHWIFDQRGGMVLGRDIADYVSGHAFQAVPEPSTAALGFIAMCGGALLARRRSTLRRKPRRIINPDARLPELAHRP
jgi:hypothetical protein